MSGRREGRRRWRVAGPPPSCSAIVLRGFIHSSSGAPAYTRIWLRPFFSSVRLFLVIITPFILSARPPLPMWYICMMQKAGARRSGQMGAGPAVEKSAHGGVVAMAGVVGRLRYRRRPVGRTLRVLVGTRRSRTRWKCGRRLRRDARASGSPFIKLYPIATSTVRRSLLFLDFIKLGCGVSVRLVPAGRPGSRT